MLLWLQNMGGAGGSLNIGHFGAESSPFYDALWKKLREREIKKRLPKLEKRLVKAERRKEKAEKAVSTASQATEKPASHRFDASRLKAIETASNEILRIKSDIRKVEREIEEAVAQRIKMRIKDDEDAIVAILSVI